MPAIDYESLDLPKAMLKRLEESKRVAERRLWESILDLHRRIAEQITDPNHDPEELRAAMKLKTEMLAELGIPPPPSHLRLVDKE